MSRALIQLAWLLSNVITNPPNPVDTKLEKILSEMTLEQKIGQLMMVGFGGRKMGKEISHLLLDHHIGSVALYGRNITNPVQLARLVHNIRDVMRGEIPPFVAIDQEGGNVVRVHSDVAVLPGAMALGATRDPVLSFLAGQVNAVDLGQLGINMNLAPVLDVNRQPANPVINIRAFGDHPLLVTNMGIWFIRGQQQGGLVTVAKHFPGHGTTSYDSHYSLPSIELNLDQLRESELMPFREAIARGLDAIMTAHVRVPAVDPSNTPASLSPKVIGELLRNEMGFDGLVITDDLEMRAISDRMEVGRAAVQAILAGADLVMVIWTPEKKQQVYETLLEAARQERLSLSRIDASVRRVLRLKANRGILREVDPRTPRISDSLPNRYHKQLMRAIAYRGITLVRNRDSLIPLCGGKGVLVVGPQKVFLDQMKRLLPECTTVLLNLVPSRTRRMQDLNTLVKQAQQYRVMVVGVSNAYQAWLVQQLQSQTQTPLIAVSFGSPYYLRNFPQVAGYLCTYSYLPTAQAAAALALCGHISITGRLPVDISDRHPRGFGVVVPRGACNAATSR